MTTVSLAQVHTNPEAAWELIGILESEVEDRDATIADQSTALTLMLLALVLAREALEPFKRAEIKLPNLPLHDPIAYGITDRDVRRASSAYAAIDAVKMVSVTASQSNNDESD